MIKQKDDTAAVITQMKASLSAIDLNKLTRLQASTIMAVMRNRIHVDGLDCNGAQIGTYSPKYMKTRQKYGRGNGSSVILSLTRSLENSMTLQEITKGCAIGYATAESVDKLHWMKDEYGDRVFKPTKEEQALVKEIGDEYIKNIIGNE